MKCPASWNLKWQVGYPGEVPSIMKPEVTSWLPRWSAHHHEISSDKLVTLMKKYPASRNLKWQVDYLDEVPSIIKIWSDKFTLMKKCPASWNLKWQVDYLDEEVPSIMKCKVRSWLPWWRSPVPPAWHAPGPAPVWLWFGMRTAACALQRYLMNTITSALTTAAYCQKMLVLFLQTPWNLLVTI